MDVVPIWRRRQGVLATSYSGFTSMRRLLDNDSVDDILVNQLNQLNLASECSCFPIIYQIEHGYYFLSVPRAVARILLTSVVPDIWDSFRSSPETALTIVYRRLFTETYRH